jgi:adenylate cyclase class 2
MVRGASQVETEIKLGVGSAAATRRLLRRQGFSIEEKRVLERNTIFDTPEGALRMRRNVLRLRQAGRRRIITFKGAPRIGRHKSREEFESAIGDAGVVSAILAGLGYTPVFRYEKYRTVYGRAGEAGSIMLDETPIGDFLELEGPARWIDRTARELGYTRSDYLTSSYGTLYMNYRESHRTAPKHMVFQRS